jgi:leucyl-tRNA synthetase
MSTSKGTAKGDYLKKTEQVVQERWIAPNVYQRAKNDKPKYFVTFPYPYMNGTMHLGHAYTLSKVEFFSRYKQLCGYNVLFPFGFHGTGMPIVACANKLKDALKTSNPLTVDIESLEDSNQIKILYKMGVPIDEIPRFTDPYYWIDYFPKRAKADLQSFGLSADFSRSFITTDVNPYYDSFVKWQFNKLNEKGLLTFGKKDVVFSPKDNQVCADHDRSVGEGVGTKEYIVVNFDADYRFDKVKLMVATTRPETFYRLVSLSVNKDGQYVIIKQNDVTYICCENMLRNLDYQEFSQRSNLGNLQISGGKYEIIENITGQDLLDYCYVMNAPSMFNNDTKINLMHSDHVKMDKGSGIVGCVPAHNIDDYYNYLLGYKRSYDALKYIDVKRKLVQFGGVIQVEDNSNWTMNIFREEFGRGLNKGSKDPEMARMRDLSKITPETKNDISKKVFRMEEEGILANTGSKYDGVKVPMVRTGLKQDIIDMDIGFRFWELEDTVISRTGEPCVAALKDQWFINYGDPTLTQKVNEHIDNTLETYDPIVKEQLKATSDWLNEWPCSRSIGLGTKLLDTDYVIDSLSDSTIYMAYYTVAHLIEKLPIEIVNDQLWDFLFLNKEYIINHITDPQLLPIIREMKSEFNYWYPLDLRVSGKDLVGNHLTMCLYNHMAVWNDSNMMPQSYMVNGHILLNGEKMSKSTGNFMTLREAVDKYGADVTRMTLAQAGSRSDDANFTDENTDASTLNLFTEGEYFREVIDQMEVDQSLDKHDYHATKEYNFWDKIFENEIHTHYNEAIKHFEEMDFYKAFNSAFHNMFGSRDSYRTKCEKGIIEPNYDLLMKYMNLQLALVYPFCPHFCETIWEYGEKKGLVFMKEFPKEELVVSDKLVWLNNLLNDFVSNTRKTYLSIMKRHAKKPMLNPDDIKLEIKMVKCYPQKERQLIEDYLKLKDTYDKRDIIATVTKDVTNKKEKGLYAQFIGHIANSVEEHGDEWTSWVTTPNDEFNDLVREYAAKLLDDTKIKTFEFRDVDMDKVGQSININSDKPRARIY